ncbi:xylulokinase [Algihabitans albus]|uniref:xylulokinase n=1 Tax=Algihabitans albus TaxID=2164067 RepID=UPI000E5CB27C|nr:FGGY-family carbohydrate kinase [Algihabitans albus]
MSGDLIVGLDSSTQSTKAVAWTRGGEAVAEGRAPIPMATPAPGFAEQDIEDWWRAACTSLHELTSAVEPARIAGLAISNQRETVAFVDEDLKATRPAIVWLDERAIDEIPLLTAAFGAERLHATSGKPPDITPVVYRLSWLRRHEPEALKAAGILDVHGFLTGRLTGRPTASWTSADPFGLFDIEAKTWSEAVLAQLDLSENRFAALAQPGSRIGAVNPAAARETGLLPGTPVFAAGGDGQCAGLGVDAVRRGIVYLNLGTAIITGAWSPTPRIGCAWRTMTSPTGQGYFLEGCQRAGAFFVNWFVDTFAGGRDDPGVFARLEAAATAIPVGSEGVTVCPYLSGVMDPHWNPKARAGFLGLGAGHGIGHLYRASLEALTLETARCVAAMADDGLAPERILAVGGGANSALWVQMIADATGLPIVLSESLEASSLGAAMSAAVGLGWFVDFAAAAETMSRSGITVAPDPAARAAWDSLSGRQAAAYHASLPKR